MQCSGSTQIGCQFNLFAWAWLHHAYLTFLLHQHASHSSTAVLCAINMKSETANGGVGNRKQSSKARQTAAASHKQEVTLALTQSLPDLIHKYQTDAVKVTLALLFTIHTLPCHITDRYMRQHAEAVVNISQHADSRGVTLNCCHNSCIPCKLNLALIQAVTHKPV